MIIFSVISRSLLHLYNTIQTSNLKYEIACEELRKIRMRVLVGRSRASMGAYDTFLELIRLHFGYLASDLALDDTARLEIAAGHPSCGASIRGQLNAMRLFVETDSRKEVAIAYRELLEDVVGVVRVSDFAVTLLPFGLGQLEQSLSQDPAQPDIWVAAARVHYRIGNRARALQLMRRACASQFAERTEAQNILTQWISEEIAL